MKFYINILIIFTLLNCAVGPTNGIIYTSNTFPGEFNPGNDVIVTKRAMSCQKSILGLFAWGDAGAGKIAYDNKILKIASIDHYTASAFIFFYRSYCTIVSGEAKYD